MPGLCLLATIFICHYIGNGHKTTGSTVQDIRAISFTQCPADLTNNNYLIGGPLTVKSSLVCATKCLDNSGCLSYNIETGIDGQKCQLSSAYIDCSDLVPSSGARTYRRDFICEKGMPELPATPPYPYPVLNINSTSDGSEKLFLCDSLTDGGGWLLLQRRNSGQVTFSRSWEDYKKGFGTLDTEFWIGLEAIHILTTSGDNYEIRFDLEYANISGYAVYDQFSVGSEAINYKLSVGAYSGTAGDEFSDQDGMAFSTPDRDNDISSGHCANSYGGAWWYRACSGSNLNRPWGQDGNSYWYTFSGLTPLSLSEIKIRRT